MSTNVYIAPYSVLRSTEELNSLTGTWAFHNKERVYCKCAPFSSTRQGPAPALRELDARQKKGAGKSVTGNGVQATQRAETSIHPSINLASRCKPHVHPARAFPTPVYAEESFVPQGKQQNLKAHLNSMVLAEEKIITIVANMFLQQASVSPSTKLGRDPRDKDFFARSSCVSITDTIHKKPLHVFIPVPPPTREQIQKSHDDSVYKKNLIMNIVSAVPSHLVKVVVSSGLHQGTSNTVYVDANRPIVVLGSTEVCNDLLFGDHRVTSSAKFWLDSEMSKNYTSAVCKYQHYNNISIGSNITLTPIYENRVPLVFSLTCPELEQTSVICTMSACKSHPKYGPNHTTKIVEIMSRVIPFVKKCSELYMNLTPDVQEQLLEDGYMPMATSEDVQHSFCSNTSQGISSYAAMHSFSLPVGMLNTYIMDTSDNREVFPMKKKLTIYVSAIYGEVPTECRGEDKQNIT